MTYKNVAKKARRTALSANVYSFLYYRLKARIPGILWLIGHIQQRYLKSPNNIWLWWYIHLMGWFITPLTVSEIRHKMIVDSIAMAYSKLVAPFKYFVTPMKVIK